MAPAAPSGPRWPWPLGIALALSMTRRLAGLSPDVAPWFWAGAGLALVLAIALVILDLQERRAWRALLASQALPPGEGGRDR